MDFQKLIDAMEEADRRIRGDYHLTLGALIALLEKTPNALPVTYSNGSSPGVASSYRGYYADLSFEPSSLSTTVETLLEEARSALNTTFEGYKGGEFVMGERTPLWAAPWGDCGPAIVGSVLTDNKLTLIVKEID